MSDRTFTLEEAQSLLPVLESLLRSAIAGKQVMDEVEAEQQALSHRIFLNGGMHVDVGRPFRELKQEVIDNFERAYLTEILRENRGNLAQAARAAGMDRKNLWALVERHGLDRDQFKKP